MTFDDLVTHGFAAVEQLVASRTEETPQLEFKTKRESSKLDLDKEDRRALGESLSGFANAVGGLLVIGVETERPDGVDRACAIRHIENLEQVADRYRAYLPDCVSPPVSGARVVGLDAGNGTGVILVDVPRGDARPHMSMAPSHQRYYRRSADRFVPMMHYEVDEMMRIKTAPNLSLIWDFQNGGSIGGNRKTFLRFGLKNDSKITAKYPYISVTRLSIGPRPSEYGLDGNYNTLWKQLTPGATDVLMFAAGADLVLHPGHALFVSRLEYLNTGEDRQGRYWIAATLDDVDEIVLDFTFGCEDVPAKTERLVLTKEQLLAAE
jgi:hypothetical protein